MSSATTHSLSRDALRALRGVVRIIRFDPLWAEDFDLDRLGFVRSFFAQFLRVPFLLLFSAVLSHAVKEKVTALTLAERAGAALAGVVAYAFVSLVAARLLKLSGWTRFINLLNWGDFAFAMIIAAMSALAAGGADGLATLQILWLVIIIPVQILFVWRAAQETMKTDISATVLLVVLNIGVSVGVDQLTEMLLP